MTEHKILIGPFAQILTMQGLPQFGHILDSDLLIIKDGGIVINGNRIETIGSFQELSKMSGAKVHLPYPAVALPGIIDSHTHLCYAGTRANDYSLRLQGMTYEEIAALGGGILDTVKATRKASLENLIQGLCQRARQLLALGVTTCEVKSGYGLNVKDELKMLSAIKEAGLQQPLTLIPTCLAAHTKPLEFASGREYLEFVAQSLLPEVIKQKLTNRVDIFVDKSAFSFDEARRYLIAAKKLGFSITIHADQFSRGGTLLAAEVGALSADHLEESTRVDFEALQGAKVIPIVLPGACLGLGMPYPDVKLMLDCGLPVVLASDANPGSAPMGNLLVQAALIGMSAKLSMAETLAAITARAAKALNLHDRGIIAKGLQADLAIFPTSDFREILYHQGMLTPSLVYTKGTHAYTHPEYT